MKKKLLFLIAIVSILALSFSVDVPVQAETGAKYISVIGDATVEVAPDTARISAEIQTVDMDSVKSKDCNLEITNKIMLDLKNSGAEKVMIDSFSTYACYDYNDGKSLSGYCTNTVISFTIENLDETKTYIDKLVEDDVTSIRNITYSSSNFDKAYEEAIALAVENAKSKCQSLGGEGMEIVSIKEDYTYSSNYLYKTYCDGVEFGEQNISVNAKVIVRFA